MSPTYQIALTLYALGMTTAFVATNAFWQMELWVEIQKWRDRFAQVAGNLVGFDWLEEVGADIEPQEKPRPIDLGLHALAFLCVAGIIFTACVGLGAGYVSLIGAGKW